MLQLWEILVPTVRNDGRPFRLKYHRVWDEKVRAITGGITILQPVKGSWKSADGQFFNERMIPVRIACSEEQMDKIIAITMNYYEQLAVMAYRISNHCIIRHAHEIKN